MKENKKKSSCLSIIGWAVLIMLISMVGRCMGRMAGRHSFEKNEPRSTLYNNQIETIDPDEELSYAISNTKKKLPVVIDEHTTWSDIILTNNALEYVYLMDDSSYDIHELDLNAYREHILKGLSTKKSDLQREMELCAETDRNMVYRLISQWNESKYVEITIENFELKKIIEI